MDTIGASYFKNLIIVLFLFTVVKFSAQNNLPKSLETVEALYNDAKYETAIASSEKLLKTIKENDKIYDSLNIAKLYFYNGASHYYLQNYNASVNAYNNGITYCPNSNDGINYKGQLYYERAFSEYELEQYIKSYNSSKQALKLLSSTDKPNLDYLISVYCAVAQNASYYGFYKDALSYLQAAEAIYETNKAHFKTNITEAAKPVLFQYIAISILNNKGILTNSDSIELKKRLKNLEQLKKQFKFNDKENLMQAVSLNFAGDLYLRQDSIPSQKSISKSHVLLDKALNILDRKKYAANYFQIQFNKSKAFKFEKKYNKAQLILDNLLLDLPNDDHHLAFFYAEKANLYIMQNNKEDAINYLKEVIKKIHKGANLIHKNYNTFKPSENLNDTGLLVEMADILLNKYPKDSTALHLASNMYKMGLTQFKNCYKEEVFSKKLKAYYAKAISGILKMKQLGIGKLDLKSLINDIENIENRLVWKSFNRNRALTKAKTINTLENKELQIRQNLVIAKKNNNLSDVSKAEKDLKNHLKSIEINYPKLHAFRYNDFDCNFLQKKLSKDEAVISYKKFDGTFYRFTITKDFVNLQAVNDSEAQLNSIKNYKRVLRQKKENKSLANILFKNLLPKAINTYKNLIVLPSAELNNLPFETLVDDKNLYLIHTKNISYVSYLAFLTANKNISSAKFDVTIFSPEYTKNNSNNKLVSRDKNIVLQGAQKETKEISNLFDAVTYTNAATKKNFINYAKQSRIVHLAMHATIDDNLPELSSLNFTNTTLGKLHLEELYGLKLNADLVVLSACNTGVTESGNDGMVSLSRAFTFSGVPSTIASLWEIPDEATQNIMISFYKNLKAKMPKSLALQEAKLEYINTTKDQNFNTPYFWAGFVLNGERAPLRLSKSNFDLSLRNGVIVVLLILIILYFFIRKYYIKR